jgi:hypothetical protein
MQQPPQTNEDIPPESIKTNMGAALPNEIIESILAMVKIDVFTKGDKTNVNEAAKRAAPELAAPELVERRKLAKETKKRVVAAIRKFMITHKNSIKFITVGERFLILRSKRKISDEVMNVFATAIESRFKTPEFVQKFITQGMTEAEYLRVIQRQQLAFLNDVIAADRPVYSIGLVKKLPTDSIFDQLNAVFAALPQATPAAST